MEKLVKEFKATTAEMCKLAQRVEDELEAYAPKALRVRLNEGFKRFMSSKEDGFTAGSKLLESFKCKNVAEIQADQLEAFVDKIGGI